MKNNILDITKQLDSDNITVEVARELLLDALGVNWIYVDNQTPPNNIELLVMSPSGTHYLTTWRPAYNIFSCQSKGSSTYDWKWKLI